MMVSDLAQSSQKVSLISRKDAKNAKIQNEKKVMVTGGFVMSRVFLLVLCALLMVGLGCKKAPITKEQREDDIREAVLRYMFEHNDSAIQQDAEVYFIAVESRTDPSQDLLAKFKGNQPRVKPVSAATHMGYGGVKDRSTGAVGIIFTIREIDWLSNTQVLVTGEYFEESESTGKSQYKVMFEDGHWVVTETEMEWIS